MRKTAKVRRKWRTTGNRVSPDPCGCPGSRGAQFALGDALIAECGKPPEAGTGPDGSYVKLKAAHECLAEHGVEYSANYLRKIRNVALRFPPARRRPVSFCMHQEAGSPEILDAAIKVLPQGEKLTVDFVQEFVRGRRDPRPGKKDKGAAPGHFADLPALMEPLVAALKMHTKAMRVAKIAEMMKALGVGLADLAGGAQSCQHRAARCLATAGAPVEERAVA